MDTKVRGTRGFGRIYQRKRTTCWWIQYYARGKLHRESAHSDDRKDAVTLLKRRFAEIGTGKVVGQVAERTTFADLERMILDDYDVNHRKSKERVECSLAHLRCCVACPITPGTPFRCTFPCTAEHEQSGPLTTS
jgi:hypothetical protein